MYFGKTRSIRNQELTIDSVVSTQPELGPNIPDGGYGWLVFFATLFFQALIPSLTVSFGVFLAFSRLKVINRSDTNPRLWDDSFMYAPLFFITTWTVFDPTSRSLISSSTWPRLVATAGTCLTCAGLLFLWMGLTEYGGSVLFSLAGIACGVGASIQTSQCEILLAQYFRLKHGLLVNISQAVTALGFVIAPIVVGHTILATNLFNVILWYQAVILQGLVCNLVFKKPQYLKSKQRNAYNYVSSNPDDEEDILSKNSRELQIKRQNSTGSNVTIEKHQISTPKEPNIQEISEPSSSSKNTKTPENWESFDNEHKDEKHNYESLKEEWETFDEDEEVKQKPKTNSWVKFEDEPKLNTKNLQLELAFAEERENPGPTTSISGVPMPLFSDLPVNNNNTYSYDILEQDVYTPRPAVFMPTTIEKYSITRLEILKQPTFYKSFLTVLTTKFSIFVYYSLFPLYVYQEVAKINMRDMTTLVGCLSITSFLFTGVSHWINIDKKRRPICLWALCWVGAFGYFMVADSKSKQVLIFGAILVILSISTLQYVGMPLLGLTIRGETNKEFCLTSVMSGCAFLFFLIINASFKNCFRLMALLHFFTGAVWFSNYIYKKIKI
ncbi:unnamed protein product [Psylliodes chrysocephalus]|uniref:Uncharacterized protein n=1 Tax=Psylliodes chrysocephalus TaxID=3402493 RepID=A0A9P0DD37_9CUCU|nr:unnamed protein product [Psylliodes chrysocephala]